MSLPVVLFLSVVVDLCSLASSADEHRFKGDNYTISCPAPQEDAQALSLYSRREVQLQVLYYYFSTRDLTVHKDFKGRVNVRPEGKTLTINIFNLQLSDTAAYWCSCVAYFSKCDMTSDKGVFLLVNEPTAETASSTAKSQNGMTDFLIPVTALTAGSVILLLMLVVGVWLVPKIKKRIRSQRPEERTSANGVYEVMHVNRKSSEDASA